VSVAGTGDPRGGMMPSCPGIRRRIVVVLAVLVVVSLAAVASTGVFQAAAGQPPARAFSGGRYGFDSVTGTADDHGHVTGANVKQALVGLSLAGLGALA
jgi:hypothetical protein